MNGIRVAMAGLVLAGGLSLGPVASAAQERPQLTLEYHFLKDYMLQEAIPGLPLSGDAEFTVSSVDFGAAIPFLVSYSQLDGIDAVAQKFKVDFLFERRDVEEIIFTQEEEDFVSLGTRLAYARRLSPRWSAIGFGGARLAVDHLDEAEPEDLTYQGGLLFEQRVRENFSWGIGAMYSQIIGSDMVLPLLQLDWRSAAERTQVKLTMPPQLLAWRATVRYFPSPAWSVGFTTELIGDEYHYTTLTTPLLDENGDVVADDASVSLAYSEVILGPELVLKPGPTFELGVIAGASVWRRFEFVAPEEGETHRFGPPRFPEATSFPEAAFDLESVFTLKFTVAYTFE